MSKIENVIYLLNYIDCLLKVSFGATTPSLSDRTEFPLFYRTVAPDSSHNPARIAFIRRFGWDTVTTFSQNEEIHSLAVNDLVTELENANISCAATITFAETDFKNQLKMLRVRICLHPNSIILRWNSILFCPPPSIYRSTIYTCVSFSRSAHDLVCNQYVGEMAQLLSMALLLLLFGK